MKILGITSGGRIVEVSEEEIGLLTGWSKWAAERTDREKAVAVGAEMDLRPIYNRATLHAQANAALEKAGLEFSQVNASLGQES